MKKVVMAASAVACSVGAFADAAAPVIDVTDAMTNFLTPIQTALTAFIPTVIPVVAAIAGLGLLFFLSKWGLRLVKSFMGASSR